MKTKSIQKSIALMAILLTCCGIGVADEYYAGGVTVDINRDVLGYLWVEDATVNLYENAHIMDDLFFGDVYAASGSVINIYGGQIDGYLYVTTSENGMPEAQVTVFGSDFMVDGVPVDPAATELFLQDKELSGVYADGTPFAYRVDCVVTADFYLTVKLGWQQSEANIEVSPAEVDLGQVDIGTTQSGIVTVYNSGNANLTLQSLVILQDDPAEFDFVPLQQLPVTIEPETSLDIEILFTPQLEGTTQAVLQIASDDPDQSVVEVALFGEGLSVILTPAEQIGLILDDYQAALDDGSIAGAGRGRCADNLARTFGKTLVMAERLINAGYDKQALMALKIAEQQCDGDRRPCDLIQGDGVPQLNEMINGLIDTINDSITPAPKWHHNRHQQWHRWRR